MLSISSLNANDQSIYNSSLEIFDIRPGDNVRLASSTHWSNYAKDGRSEDHARVDKQLSTHWLPVRCDATRREERTTASSDSHITWKECPTFSLSTFFRYRRRYFQDSIDTQISRQGQQIIHVQRWLEENSARVALAWRRVLVETNGMNRWWQRRWRSNGTKKKDEKESYFECAVKQGRQQLGKRCP